MSDKTCPMPDGKGGVCGGTIVHHDESPLRLCASCGIFLTDEQLAALAALNEENKLMRVDLENQREANDIDVGSKMEILIRAVVAEAQVAKLKALYEREQAVVEAAKAMVDYNEQVIDGGDDTAWHEHFDRLTGAVVALRREDNGPETGDNGGTER